MTPEERDLWLANQRLISRVTDLERRFDTLEGQIRARLKEEADLRALVEDEPVHWD